MNLQWFFTISVPYRTLWGFIAILQATTCLLYSPNLLARSAGIQSQTDIKRVITQYIRAEFPATFQINSQIGRLDRRLRLKQCQQSLQAFYPTGARKLGPTTIGVRCLGDTPWQIFISVQIKAFGPAVVSKRALPRGTIIHASDLSIATRELSRAIQGYYTSTEQIEGMELRYSLANGSIIGPKALKPRHLVKRGDIVTILAESNGLHIRVKGKALMDGFRGQSIRIKNSRSQRELQAEVIASRTVRVKL